MKHRYSVVLTPEPDGSAYNVTSPDIPELVTFGATREEALAMAQDCAEGLILSWMDADDEVPETGGAAEIATIEVDVDALRERLSVATSAAHP
ncbi:MAG: type II toxin-antitoxin system HicB family antitoxin [Thermomicrobiales bacterium]